MFNQAMKCLSLAVVLLCPWLATAQLAVRVMPPKVVGQKAIVELAMTNQLAVKVESARAMCFLLDEQGKMVGQSAKWIIGGTKDRPALEPKNGTTFSFVIPTPQLFTATNLTTRVTFTRLVLAGGQVADPNKDIIIEQAQKK